MPQCEVCSTAGDTYRRTGYRSVCGPCIRAGVTDWEPASADPAPAGVPEALKALTEQLMPCTCLPEYSRAGRVDPSCRHLARDQLVTAAVTWVRRRDRELAVLHRASYEVPSGNGWSLRSFAELLDLFPLDGMTAAGEPEPAPG